MTQGVNSHSPPSSCLPTFRLPPSLGGRLWCLPEPLSGVSGPCRVIRVFIYFQIHRVCMYSHFLMSFLLTSVFLCYPINLYLFYPSLYSKPVVFQNPVQASTPPGSPPFPSAAPALCFPSDGDTPTLTHQPAVTRPSPSCSTSPWYLCLPSAWQKVWNKVYMGGFVCFSIEIEI